MAPRIRSYSLENRTNRLRLPVRRKSYSVQIAVRPAVRLAYRRNLNTGTWSAMADGWLKAFAVADDFEDANGITVLTYHQAIERARQLARGQSEEDTERPVTVSEAVDRYETDLEARGGSKKNAARVRANLSEVFARKSVALLAAKELRQWRDDLVKRIRPSSVNRTCKAMKAALNLARSLDPRITNVEAWETGLAAIPDAEESRNVILPDDAVRAVVAKAYELKYEFGLLVETLAVTGSRISQVLRLTVGDLLADRLIVPASRKGRGRNRIEKRPIPIPTSLATKLRKAAASRRDDAVLLLNSNGDPFPPDSQRPPFRLIAKAAGLDPAVVTLYALRHSSIVRQLLAGVPTRVVASHHDTSVGMIEKTYSKYILDHTDALTRRALLDLNPVPSASNVALLSGGAQ